MGAKEAIPPNMSEVWGQEVSISMFVDAYLAGYKSTKCIQIGVLIVINKDPIHWYINSQADIESSTFGANVFGMKTGVDMVQSLFYKLGIFGVPMDVSANMPCDNDSIYNNIVKPESFLKKKHNYIA